MRIKLFLLVLLLLSLANNNSFAQGTGDLVYGYVPYTPTPVPVVYYQPQYFQPVQVIYPVIIVPPITSYEYIPYYVNVNRNVVYYPTNLVDQRRYCFKLFRNY